MSTELATPRGFIEVGGEEMLVSELSLSLQVGSYPTAAVTLHEDTPMSESVQETSSSSVTSRIADLQSSMFEGRTSPDTKLTLELEKEGGLQSIEFPGFLTAPRFKAGEGDFRYQYGVSHESSILSAFSPGAYIQKKEVRSGDLSTDLKKLESMGNLKTFLKEVLDFIVANQIDQKVAKNLSTRAQIYRNNLLSLNEVVKPYWDAVVDATPDGVWDLFSDLRATQKRRIVEHLAGRFLSGGPAGFGSIRASLESDFQILYVPSVTKPYGAFIPFSQSIEDPESLTLDVSTSNIQTGSQSFLPTTVVSVRGVYLNKGQHRVEPKDSIVACWPEAALPLGRAHEIPSPRWLGLDSLPVRNPEVQGYVSLESYKNNLKPSVAYNEKLSSKDSAAALILREYAKNAYGALALGFSRTTISVPMDLTLKVGKVYDVTMASSTGTPGKFRGFLSAVTHIMQTSENKGTARSVLSFSHLQAEDFRIPYSDEG